MKSREIGFTLAELLGVIVIIGILLVLIVPTVINRLNSSKDEASDTGDNIIYNATDQYIREHPSDYPPGKAGRYCIAIKNLIDDGKLTKPVIDVSTGEDVSDKSVMVTIYSAGTSDYEIRDGDDCKALSSLPLIDFEVTPKGSSWVPKRTAKIIWPAIDGEYRARYRVDNGEWQYVDSIDSKKGGTKELVFDKSAVSRPLEAQYIGKGGDTGTDNIINSKINIVNVDSVAPTCTLRLSGTMGNNNWYRSNVTIDFGNNNSNLKDDLSGVADYGISTSSSNSFGKVSKKTQTQDVANITYYGFVKDKAGNIGKCNVSLKKDATKPTLSYTLRKINNGQDVGAAYSNQWSRNQIKRSFSPKDNLSGVAKMQYKTTGTNTWYDEGNVSSWMMNEGRNDASFRVIDNAGNVSDETRLILLVDWTAPQCSVSRSNQGSVSGVNFNYKCSDNVSGVLSCPPIKYNQKGYVDSISIRDNAGNVGSCSAQSVTSQVQYRTSTRYNLGCTNSYCCGSDPYQYVCGSYCTRWFCMWGKVDGSAGNPQFYSSIDCMQTSHAYDSYYYILENRCVASSPSYCTGYSPRFCYSSCCGTAWTNWTAWGAGYYCNTATCKSENRTLYY